MSISARTKLYGPQVNWTISSLKDSCLNFFFVACQTVQAFLNGEHTKRALSDMEELHFEGSLGGLSQQCMGHFGLESGYF